MEKKCSWKKEVRVMRCCSRVGQALTASSGWVEVGSRGADAVGSESNKKKKYQFHCLYVVNAQACLKSV